MQDTVAEHAASRFAVVPCQGCHMKPVREGDGSVHADHRFAAQTDPALLESAVRVELARRSEGQVVVALTPNQIGHAFPTGDLFRRAELRLWLGESTAPKRRPDAVYVLERTYHMNFATLTKEVVRDTRLLPATKTDTGRREVEIQLAHQGRPISFQLVWQRFPPQLGEALRLSNSAHERVVVDGVWRN